METELKELNDKVEELTKEIKNLNSTIHSIFGSYHMSTMSTSKDVSNKYDLINNIEKDREIYGLVLNIHEDFRYKQPHGFKLKDNEKFTIDEYYWTNVYRSLFLRLINENLNLLNDEEILKKCDIKFNVYENIKKYDKMYIKYLKHLYKNFENLDYENIGIKIKNMSLNTMRNRIKFLLEKAGYDPEEFRVTFSWKPGCY